MRVLRAASEVEVVAAYLRAELVSERFGANIRRLLERDGVPESALARPDLTDAGQNTYRLNLLDEHRGWSSRRGMFGGFPERVTWSRVALTPEEVATILYIHWDWWLQLTEGSRLPSEAASRIRARLVPETTAEEHEPIAAALVSGANVPELIVVTATDRRRLVVVEGHVRLTAYMLFPHVLPPELELFLGEADGIERWPSF